MGVCVIGSLNLDIVCRVAELPRPGETVTGLGVERLPGGKGANQAVAAARCGVPTRLIGAVGRDEAGLAMIAALDAAGVDTSPVLELEGHPTGQAFIWVSAAGENSIVVAGGANAAVTPDQVAPAALDGCHVLLAQLETPVDAIEALFAQAQARGSLRILNAAPAMEAGRRLFDHADILVVNETELARYAGLAEVPTTPAAIAEAVLALGLGPRQRVIVTLGAAGALAFTAGSILVVAGRPAQVIDTTGAGDCFCGALAARLAEGADLEAALRWANAAASLSTERPGATPSMPERTEIEAMIAP
jgi:ribokinase